MADSQSNLQFEPKAGQDRLRCVLVGATVLAIRCAKELFDRGCVICGVASCDEDVLKWAQENAIRHTAHPCDIADFVAREPFEYLFIVANPHEVDARILEYPRKAAIRCVEGAQKNLLPIDFGGQATFWAILKGESSHRVSWRVERGIDAGDILAQRTVPIGECETALTLTEKLLYAVVESLAELIGTLDSGSLSTNIGDTSKDSPCVVNRYPPDACVISWHTSARQIDALVRGLEFGSYPNVIGTAKIALEGSFIIARSVEIIASDGVIAPGTITDITENGIRIATCDGDIILQEAVSLEGRRLRNQQLSEQFGIRRGLLLPTLPTEELMSLTELYMQARSYESLWVTRFAELAPLEFPFLSRTNGELSAQFARRPLTHNRVARCQYERTPGTSGVSWIIAALCIFVSRLSKSERFGIGYSGPETRHETAGKRHIFAESLPIVTNGAFDYSFKDVLNDVRVQLDFITDHPLCAIDVVTRYPRLTGSDALQLPIQVFASNDVSGFLPWPGCALAIEISASDNLYWHYDRSRIDDEDMARLDLLFAHACGQIAFAPNEAVAQLSLLDSSTKSRIVHLWNSTAQPYPFDKCLHHLIEEQVRLTPQAIAIIAPDRNLSYAELDKQANQLAHALLARGVKRGDRVAVFLERSSRIMIALLGVLKTGAAYVPLDPTHPKERVDSTLKEADVRITVSQKSLLRTLQGATAVLVVDADTAEWENQGTNIPSVNTSSNDVVYVIFTSGSTGRPKGVEVRHRGIVNLISWMQQEFKLNERSVFPALASVAFDMSVDELFPPLVVGGTLLLAESGLAANGEELARYLRTYGANHLQFTPTTWALLLEAGFSGKDCTRVSVAEPLPRDLLRRLIDGAENQPVYNGYGPTETSVWATCHRFDSADQPIVIGRPISNVQIYIMDSVGAVCPVGVPGEIWIGGDGVASGYLKQPDLTAEKFLDNPFTSGQKIYRTGDLGLYRNDGRIEFLGRMDYQVKIRGYRIELSEIERVLGENPAVRECVVLAREDVPGDKRLVAYVVAGREAALDFRELRKSVKEQLPEYMVPTAFVLLEKLPLTPNGKLDRKNLPVPEYGEISSRGAREASSPTEEIIAGIWEEVLRLERVGVEEDFFALGGHSLLAMQVTSRIRMTFRVNLPLRALFEAPTVSSLAQRVDQLKGSQTRRKPAIRALKRPTFVPLSRAQQRLWFLDQMQPCNSYYNLPLVFRVCGQLRIGLLERCVNEIVARHEALRTIFVEHEGFPTQQVSPYLPFSLQVVDFCGEPDQSEREVSARRLANNWANEPFDLQTGPVCRFVLVRMSQEHHLFGVCLHHIVGDGWSGGVFQQELATLYEALGRGEVDVLPPLTIQYADYALWERGELDDGVRGEQLDYWKRQLAGAPPLLNLPADRERPGVQSFQGGMHLDGLPTEMMTLLKRLGQRQGCTLFMALAAVFELLLSKLTGCADIVVGTDVANRPTVELEKLIGFFVNVLPLRVHLSGDPTFLELLERVREAALELYSHQEVPFDRLVEEFSPERGLSHNPLVQVLFVMHNTPHGMLALPGLRVSRFELDVSYSKFDLAVFVRDDDDKLLMEWVFNRELFDQSTIELWACYYRTLVQQVLARPSARIDELDHLTQAERVEQDLQRRQETQQRARTLRNTRRKAAVTES